MIFNTDFKSLMLESFINDISHDGGNYDGFKSGGLVIYSGTMPTNQEYLDDWASLYDATRGSEGTNALTVYGRVGSGRGQQHMVNLDHDSDGNFTLDVSTINDMDVDYIRDGVATWAAYFPWSNVSYNAVNNSSPQNSRYFLCTVSDGTGDGIVQLDDTTIIGQAPILSSFGFSFSAGGQ